MKSKLLLLLVALVLLGGGYYVYSQKKTADILKEELMTEEDVMEKTEDTEEKDTFSGNIKSLIARNIPLKCEYTSNEYSYEGWIKGTNMRTEYETPEGEGTVIIKDNCMYTWINGENQGFTFCSEDTKETIWDSSEIDANMPDSFDCRPALVDDSAFELPSDVEFLSLGDMMKDIPLDE